MAAERNEGAECGGLVAIWADVMSRDFFRIAIDHCIQYGVHSRGLTVGVGGSLQYAEIQAGLHTTSK